MSWEEANLSLLLEAEMRVGFVIRERQRMAREIEDAVADRAIAAVGG
jgi:signal transduction histidine kinase